MVREYGPFQGPTRVLASPSDLRGRDPSVALPKEAGEVVYTIRALMSVSKGTASVAMTVTIPFLEHSA